MENQTQLCVIYMIRGDGIMSRLETPTLRQRLNDDAFETIFRAARTYNGWLDKPVSDETVREIYKSDEMGTDERQLVARPLPALAVEGCQGAAATSARPGKRAEDNVRACDRNRCL